MHRVAVTFIAIVIALAAPVRAWCEASCLKPAATESHCPAHERSDRPTVSASEADCPVIDAARPIPIARDEAPQAAPLAARDAAPLQLTRAHYAPRHLSTPAPQHRLSPPLRI